MESKINEIILLLIESRKEGEEARHNYTHSTWETSKHITKREVLGTMQRTDGMNEAYRNALGIITGLDGEELFDLIDEKVLLLNN